MLRLSSHRANFRTLLKLSAIVLGTALAGYGQSLGDVARENRAK